MANLLVQGFLKELEDFHNSEALQSIRAALGTIDGHDTKLSEDAAYAGFSGAKSKL